MDISEAIKIKDPASLKRHPWEIARCNVIDFFLATQKGFPFIHIADIGCGDGYILQHLVKNDAAFHFSAVDPFFTVDILKKLEASSRKKNVSFYNKISELTRNKLSLDCILLLDVLEHVPDDEKLLLEIRQHASITKEATWIITVPAFQSLFSNHDQRLNHYRRYNLEQLSALCERSSLIIDKKGYFFFTLIPLRIFQKIFSSFSKKETESTVEDWKGGKFLSAILRATLWADFKISFFLSKCGINIPGLSCYCICH